MASTTQDKLYETFVTVAGQQEYSLGGVVGSSEEIASSLSDTVKEIRTLKGSSAAQAMSSGSAANLGTTSGGSTPDADKTSVGSTVQKIVSTVFESGLGVVPLIVHLLGLFGGAGTPAPPALVKYAMPDPIYLEGATTGSDISGADYDQTGMPRMYNAAPNETNTRARGFAVPDSSSSSPTSGAPAPQITVNVQAMDSRSFLDHSSEIAQAVRDAMLNLNSINDVVNDL